MATCVFALSVKDPTAVTPAWTPITPDVLRGFTYTRGITGDSPTDRVARTGQLSFTLNNSARNAARLAGLYSPLHANYIDWPLQTERVRVQATYSATTYNLFTGWMSELTPEPGQYADRTTSAGAVDYMNWLAVTNWYDDAMINSRIDQALTAILANVMACQPDSTSFATGGNIYDYLLYREKSGKTTNLTVFQKLAQTDYGYIFTDGAGALTYETRHSRIGRASAVTLSNTMTGVDYEYNTGNQVTDVNVTYSPVRIGTAGEVVASVDAPIEVNQGTPVIVTLDYKNQENLTDRISIVPSSGVTPVEGTDYYVYSDQSGTGDYLIMSAVTVGVVWDANSAKVTLTCTSGGKVFVFPFKLRAQGIYASDQLTATATNWSGGANPALYPHNELTYSNPYAGDSYFCADLATTILTRNTNPGKVKSVAFNANYSAALMVAALSLDIGDRITLAETQTALAEDYYINGVKMDYDALAKKLTCTWYLEIADWNDNAFRLDIDTLDGGKVLVF